MATEQTQSGPAAKAEVWGVLHTDGGSKHFRLGVLENDAHLSAVEATLKANKAWQKITVRRMKPSEVSALVAFLQPMALPGWKMPPAPVKSGGFVRITGEITCKTGAVKRESKRWHVFVGWPGKIPMWGHGMHWVPTAAFNENGQQSAAYLAMGTDKQQKRTYRTEAECFKAAEEHAHELALQMAGLCESYVIFIAQDERIAAAWIQKVAKDAVKVGAVYAVQRSDGNVATFELLEKVATPAEQLAAPPAEQQAA